MESILFQQLLVAAASGLVATISQAGTSMFVPNECTDPREAAARALCDYEGVPEDALFEGRPMWMSYLEQVDVVLDAIGWKADMALVVAEE